MDFFSTNLFNWYGLAFAIALLVPDIVYIKSNRIDRTIFDNRAMLYIERIGKYCSIFLMGINIGVFYKADYGNILDNLNLCSDGRCTYFVAFML